MNEEGEQGPDLSLVGIRLKRQKLLESVIYPSAEITPGMDYPPCN